MKTHLKIKEVDDVLGGKESWANVDKAQSTSRFSTLPTGESLADDTCSILSEM